MIRALPLAAIVPLVAAAVSAVSPSVAVRRLIAAVALAVTGGIGILVLRETAGGDVLVTEIGGFPPPFAIAFAADTFAALMLVVFAVVPGLCLTFAALRGHDDVPRAHAGALGLVGASAGATLTADLFNLFVWIEVLLLASYVLITLGATPRRVRTGTIYVATNLLGSTVFLSGVALVYATAGTVNLGALRGAAAASGAVAVGATLVVVALAVKSSLVPVHAWLPRTYPDAPTWVTALFSGTLTKVGIVALFRVVTVVFDGEPVIGAPLLLIAGLTMVIGVVGAVGRTSMRSILSFHMVSQMGYLVMALGIGTVGGLTAGVFFLVQYIGVKTALFLVAGTVESDEGSDDLDQLGGLVHRRPALAGVFLLSAFALVGVPPLSGFVAKFGLLRAAFDDGAYAIGATAVAVSFLTLLSMVKIWNAAFWGSSPEEPTPGASRPWLFVPAAVLALATLAIGIAAQPLWRIAERAAAGLVDVAAYAGAVAP
ncbi:MAG TPA: proton-conducting transporter membrane subunit [Actinomycetota bacterium]|nr:proton-conducting transporter membrane subunit [Actinomycetota bacterium]